MFKEKEKVRLRLNLLPFSEVFLEINKESRDYVITSLIEHNISDLGFHIQLHSDDMRNVNHDDFLSMDEIIENVLTIILLKFESERKITINYLAPFIYDLIID